MSFALNAPSLTYPNNGANLSSISASLEWNSISGTSRYEWQCDTTENFDSPFLATGTSTRGNPSV